MNKLSVNAFACLVSVGFSAVASANQVHLTTNQPLSLTFKIAHKNPGSEPVFSEPKTIKFNSSATVPFEMEGYTLAGLVPININGIELPADVNEFDKPNTCSITVDKTKQFSMLEFKLEPHKLSCAPHGGIFQ